MNADAERRIPKYIPGFFHETGRYKVVIAEDLCRDVDPHPGQRVLDVGCGGGAASLAAGRRYCEVTGINNNVPAFRGLGEARAKADGMDIDFRDGDPEALPFSDSSFDVVLSVFGVQFAPDPEKAASEMLRVTRSGGKIALAGPVPEGWTGNFFTTLNQHASPSPGALTSPDPGVRPPFRWGTADRLRELLGEGSVTIESEKRTAFHYYRSIDHAWDLFLNIGPSNRAAGAGGEHTRARLRRDLEAVFERYNRASDGTAVIEMTYLQTIATRA